VSPAVVGKLVEIEHQDNKYTEVVLPPDVLKGTLYLEAKGADGGRRYYNDGMLINDHYANGGEGATLAGKFEIGDGPNEIPPGSRIRFIIGEKGGSDNSMGNAGSGGGGGTAILFGPSRYGGQWTHLIIAGGGGGAHADAAANQNSGKGGVASPDCAEGTGGERHLGAAGGGGWKEDGEGGDDFGLEEGGGKAGWPNYDSDTSDPGPIGGEGGSYGTHGGWGYGGGGHSKGDLEPGGGGGGACGGDGGTTSAGGTKWHGGAGGKSWMNQEFVWEEVLRQNGGTVRSPQDGYVEYQVTKIPAVSDILAISGDGVVIVRDADNNILCDSPSSCNLVEIDTGDQLILEAIPDNIAVFTGWEGEGCAMDTICDITVALEMSIVATFDTPMVTVEAICISLYESWIQMDKVTWRTGSAGGTSETCDYWQPGNCFYTVPLLIGNLKFKAGLNAGFYDWDFIGWYGACSGTLPWQTCTVDSATVTEQVIAYFAKNY
jgi:hypothetical protein